MNFYFPTLLIIAFIIFVAAILLHVITGAKLIYCFLISTVLALAINALKSRLGG